MPMNGFLNHKRCFIPGFDPGVTPLPPGILTMPIKTACRRIISDKPVRRTGHVASYHRRYSLYNNGFMLSKMAG